MSESGADYQTIAKEFTAKQIQISVGHGMRNQYDSRYDGRERMNQLNKEAQPVPEKFRSVVKESVRWLGRQGIAPEVMARTRQKLAVASWGTRGERITDHLRNISRDPEKRNDIVWETIDEIDLQYAANVREKDGTITSIGVRKSVNLPQGETVEYRNISGNDLKFPESSAISGSIVIDGQAFSRNVILATLDGHQEMLPQYDVDGYVLLPLRNQDGNLFLIRFDYGQIIKIESGFRVLKKVDVDAGKETSFDPGVIVSGGASLASPDHGLQDMHDNFILHDQAGTPIAKREVVVDGSGGSLYGKNYDQATQDRLIGEKMNVILRGIRKYRGEHPSSALQKASIDAKNATAVVNGTAVENPAYGTGLVCDFTSDGISIANAGDVACLLWKDKPFADKRNQKVFKNQSGPSRFQLQNMMHNLAQAMKEASPQLIPTKLLDEDPGANNIYRQIGEGQVQVDSVRISPEDLVNENPEFVLIFSDGGRPGSNILVDNDTYSTRVSKILADLKAGKISGATKEEQLNNASMMIVEAARFIAGDTDDITVRIVDIGEYVKWCMQKVVNEQQKH